MTFEDLKYKYGQLVRRYHLDAGFELKAAKEKAFEEMKTDYRKGLQEHYLQFLQNMKDMRADTTHQAIRQTAKRLRDDDDYDDDEAIHNAVKKRKVLLERIIEAQDPPVLEDIDDDDDDDDDEGMIGDSPMLRHSVMDPHLKMKYQTAEKAQQLVRQEKGEGKKPITIVKKDPKFSKPIIKTLRKK